MDDAEGKKNQEAGRRKVTIRPTSRALVGLDRLNEVDAIACIESCGPDGVILLPRTSA